MYITLLIIFFLVSVLLVAMIILQQGKSSDMVMSFDSGASATLFGSSGSGNFITRITSIFAILFFVISLILGNIISNKNVTENNWENMTESIKFKKLNRVRKLSTSPIIEIPHSLNNS